MSVTQGKKTALYGKHVELGARMVPFAGYLMPLLYSGQIAEHRAVRSEMGLFDLSHMGEFRLIGARALEAADALITNRLLGTAPGQAVYSPMCRDDGGIVDDLILYHLPDSVMVVANAANIEKDETWIREHLPPGVRFENESDRTALVAVQGPATEAFLAPLSDVPLAGMETYTALRGRVAGVEALISRTGYTGEDGFELYVASEGASELWARLLEDGSGRGLVPVGLAARDTLRFEMGYCLYGNDIDEETTPLEAGLGWTVKLDKDFVGREALLGQKTEGIPRRLVGLRPESEKTIPRRGYPVFEGQARVGVVTSGTFSPSLSRGLGLAYVEAAMAEPGRELEIDVRGRRSKATVKRTPFYTEGSRKALSRRRSK
jgi:aminomethyltransferase